MRQVIYILLSLIFIMSSRGYADDVNSEESSHLLKGANDLKETYIILNNYNKGTLSDNDLLYQITACSNKGNKYCTSMLGKIYFDNEKYSQAYPLLLKSSGIRIRTGDPDVTLGYMYSTGTGVLQNQDKAIYFLKKSAHLGKAYSALMISTIYIDKVKAGGTVDELKNNFVASYAWEKIAKALGQDSYKLKDGKTRDVYSEIEDAKSVLIKYSALDEANEMASEICSSIPKCVQ